MAEKLALVSYVLVLISIAGLYLELKKHSKAKLVSFLALVVALVGVILAQQTGTTGGEIRHTEILENTAKSSNTDIDSAGSEHQEKHLD
jgi:hypothetical protein